VMGTLLGCFTSERTCYQVPLILVGFSI
jgi:hypothetical protein